MQKNISSHPISEFVVAEDMSVSQITKKFKQIFPFLRLEIFFNGKAASGSYPTLDLSKLSSKRKLLPFVINPEIKVEELIELFWNNMGLQVSVARKLANSTVETTFTNKWTLQQQNEVGSEFFYEFEQR